HTDIHRHTHTHSQREPHGDPVQTKPADTERRSRGSSSDQTSGRRENLTGIHTHTHTHTHARTHTRTRTRTRTHWSSDRVETYFLVVVRLPLTMRVEVETDLKLGS